MKNFSILTILLVALVLSAAPANAQTVITPTTLSVAMTTASGQTMIVASASPYTIPTGQAVFAVGNTVLIEKEAMTVKSVNGTTIGVIRGQGGTTAAPHISGDLVFAGLPGGSSASGGLISQPIEPQGSCTRTNYQYLPLINTRTGIISDCSGGRVVNGVRSNGVQKFHIMSPEPGGTAYTAVNTNGTTLGATTLYCSEVFVPANKLLTGIALLNGTTVGTDNHYVVLYDASGNALANSALAGAVAASASAYQEFAFTSTFYAVGPARYFGCMQTNGTTATVRMAVTGTNDNLLTKGQTAATFGTVPALTVPTTFTTAVGPYVYVY